MAHYRAADDPACIALLREHGGPEALALLAKGSFDVVVTDMRMPKMDGAGLLLEIKKCYPNVVRIILSGHSDKELILKSLAIKK